MDLLVLLTAPLVAGVLCRLAPRAEALNAIGATVTLGAGLSLAWRVFGTGPVTSLGDLLYVDALGALITVVIVVVGFLAALYSIGYLKRDVEHGKVPAEHVGWYYLAYHAFIWTMLVTGTVNNLGLLWVAIEATTSAKAS